MSSAPRERGAEGSDAAVFDGNSIVPQRPVTWNGRVHPVAECFPLLRSEDAEELAQDIKAHGLRQAIVLDADGTLIDGRNRLEACRIYGVMPHFVVLPLGADEERYIMSANIVRRHLDAGQRAMVVARIRKVCGKPLTTTEAAADADASPSRMKYAAVVIKHGDDKLVDDVISGETSLDDAYRAVKLSPPAHIITVPTTIELAQERLEEIGRELTALQESRDACQSVLDGDD